MSETLYMRERVEGGGERDRQTDRDREKRRRRETVTVLSLKDLCHSSEGVNWELACAA